MMFLSRRRSVRVFDGRRRDPTSPGLFRESVGVYGAPLAMLNWTLAFISAKGLRPRTDGPNPGGKRKLRLVRNV